MGIDRVLELLSLQDPGGIWGWRRDHHQRPGSRPIRDGMRYNGEDRETGEYHGHGFTCLLDNMQAAFLDVKLRYLPQWIVRRKAIAEKYRKALSDLPDLLLPHYDDPRRDHVYQNYTCAPNRGMISPSS